MNGEVTIYKITVSPYHIRVWKYAADEKKKIFVVHEKSQDRNVKKANLNKIREGMMYGMRVTYTIDEGRVEELLKETIDAAQSHHQKIIDDNQKCLEGINNVKTERIDWFDWRNL